MNFRRMRTIAAIAVPCFLLHGSAIGQNTATFDADAEGWTLRTLADPALDDFNVIGNYVTTFVSSGGNPGGHIQVGDPDNGASLFLAPVSGDQSGAFGGTFSYDIIHNGANNYFGPDLILEGGGLRLLWTASPPLNPTSAWSQVTLTFAPSAEWRSGTSSGPAATAADFETALGNLTALMIKAEYTFGIEMVGIDNVTMSLLCPPDLNDDGAVNLSDLAILLANFGCSAGGPPCTGDVDGDGDSDLSDLSILLANFGTSCA